MANKFYIDKVTETDGVVSKGRAKVNDDAQSPTYDLTELSDGLVIKDNVDGTTAWKITVNKSGELATEQVTTE